MLQQIEGMADTAIHQTKNEVNSRFLQQIEGRADTAIHNKKGVESRFDNLYNACDKNEWQ